MAMTEQERKNRVIARAITRERAHREKMRLEFKAEIQYKIHMMEYDREAINDYFAERDTTNEERKYALEDRYLQNKIRLLNRAEWVVYNMKLRYKEIYNREYWEN